VTGTNGDKSECIFCESGDAGRDDLVLVRGRLSYVVLNLYPYNNGHLMVVPNRHVASLAALTPEELSEMVQLTRDAEIVLNEAYVPQGINIGINLGRAAGAGVVDHVHIHVVPRWNGDTNFMTVVSDVRVLPEDLTATKKRLQPLFERLAGEQPAAGSATYHEGTKAPRHEDS